MRVALGVRVAVHLTQSRADLHVKPAAVGVTGTLHGALSHVWKSADADTRQTHDAARLVHGARPAAVRDRQHRHERLQ